MYLSDKEYETIFSKCIRLCIDLACMDGSEILLGKRAHEPFQGQYALPGGRMKFGETISDAIDRIADEELGLKIKRAELVTILEFQEEIELCGRHSISIVYLCNYEGEPKIRLDVFSEIVRSSEVAKNQILPQHLKAVEYLT